jgi:hypothetical protein
LDSPSNPILYPVLPHGGDLPDVVEHRDRLLRVEEARTSLLFQVLPDNSSERKYVVFLVFCICGRKYLNMSGTRPRALSGSPGNCRQLFTITCTGHKSDLKRAQIGFASLVTQDLVCAGHELPVVVEGGGNLEQGAVGPEVPDELGDAPRVVAGVAPGVHLHKYHLPK